MTTTVISKPATNGSPVSTLPPPAFPPAAKVTTTTAAAPEAAEGAEETKTRIAKKVYIVIGEVKEFKNAAEAEKFLNTDPTAPKDFTVIKGSAVNKKQKVSLR